MKLNKPLLKKIFINTLWVLTGSGFITLLSFSIIQQQQTVVKSIATKIDFSETKMFVTVNDVNHIIKTMGYDTLYQQPIQKVAWLKLERAIEANSWVADANVVTDKNGHVNIQVIQSCPLIRIINNNSVGFYVTKNGKTLPTHPMFTPRILVVTGEISSSDFSEKYFTHCKQYQLLKMSKWISENKFWNAQVTQINVLPNQDLELFTLSGDATIDFGTADDFENKFNKLKLFYDEGLNKVGWNKYNRIIIKYDRQIVGVKN
jgi:cell division protein FtsQ